MQVRWRRSWPAHRHPPPSSVRRSDVEEENEHPGVLLHRQALRKAHPGRGDTGHRGVLTFPKSGLAHHG